MLPLTPTIAYKRVTFPVRVDLHRRYKVRAAASGVSMQELFIKALEEFLANQRTDSSSD